MGWQEDGVSGRVEGGCLVVAEDDDGGIMVVIVGTLYGDGKAVKMGR